LHASASTYGAIPKMVFTVSEGCNAHFGMS
jgi:hypothetical protein